MLLYCTALLLGWRQVQGQGQCRSRSEMLWRCPAAFRAVVARIVEDDACGLPAVQVEELRAALRAQSGDNDGSMTVELGVVRSVHAYLSRTRAVGGHANVWLHEALLGAEAVPGHAAVAAARTAGDGQSVRACGARARRG